MTLRRFSIEPVSGWPIRFLAPCRWEDADTPALTRESAAATGQRFAPATFYTL